MGVTGATGVLNSALPELLERVHKESGNIPTVVGFGISTREHFLSVGKIAEGAVVGSQIVHILAESPAGHGAKSVQDYCSRLTGRRGLLNETTKAAKASNAINEEKEPANSASVSEFVRGDTGLGQLKALNTGGGADPDVSVKRPILAWVCADLIR
jgi:tryptophan synthase